MTISCCNNKPRLVLAKGPTVKIACLWHRNFSTKSRPHGHFGNGNSKPAISNVMRGADTAAKDLPANKTAGFLFSHKVKRWRRINVVIAVMLLISKREALGWRTITELTAQEADRETTQSSALPARIVGISLAVCAATLFCLIPLNDNNQGMLAGFGLALALLSSLMLHLSRRMRQTT